MSELLTGVRTRPFRPVEPLESRDCPAVAAFFVGDTLFLFGDDSANTADVQIAADGRVSAIISGPGAGNVAEATADRVTTVIGFGFGGNDSFRVAQAGARTAPLVVTLDLGLIGDAPGTLNEAVIDLSGGVSGTVAAVAVTGGAGADTATTRLGALTNANVAVAGYLGDGTNALDAVLFGGITGASNLGVAAAGGAGADTIRLRTADGASVGVGASAQVYAALTGGGGHDDISVFFRGRVDGVLRGVLDGAEGNDRLTADVRAGGGGQVQFALYGGAGDDDLRGLLRGPLFGTFGAADGGEGRDRVTHTFNVLPLNAEQTQFVF